MINRFGLLLHFQVCDSKNSRGPFEKEKTNLQMFMLLTPSPASLPRKKEKGPKLAVISLTATTEDFSYLTNKRGSTKDMILNILNIKYSEETAVCLEGLCQQLIHMFQILGNMKTTMCLTVLSVLQCPVSSTGHKMVCPVFSKDWKLC